jgi:hypothetical protein
MAIDKVTYINIANNPKGEVVVQASLSQDINFKTQNVAALKKSHKASLGLLSNYYRFGQENNKNKIIGTFFTEDGSRKWVKQELLDIPDKFLGFNKLSKINAVKLFYWGDYEIYVVDWYISKNKKAMGWYEATICNKNNACFVSNVLLNGGEISSLYSSMLSAVLNKPVTPPVSLPEQISIYPNYQVNTKQKPLNISYNVNWLDTPVVLKEGGQLSGLPIKNKSLGGLHRFLSELSVLSNKEIFLLPNNGNKMSAHWASFDPAKLFPVVVEDEDLGRQKHYTPYAYFKKLQSLDNLQVYGYIHGENESYAIAKGEKSGNSGLMLFTINNTDFKLQQVSRNSLLETVMQSTPFQHELANTIKSRK